MPFLAPAERPASQSVGCARKGRGIRSAASLSQSRNHSFDSGFTPQCGIEGCPPSARRGFSYRARLVFALPCVSVAGRVPAAKRAIARIAPTVPHTRDSMISRTHIRCGAGLHEWIARDFSARVLGLQDQLESLLVYGGAPLLHSMGLREPESSTLVQVAGWIQSFEGPQDHFSVTGSHAETDCLPQ